MILENGLIRTLDPQVPTQRALAIAGEWIAGGVGVHETALASPEVVDLGGRTVLPGFNDSHVHFPTWALAQTQVSLEGCGSLVEALDRIRGAERRDGRWLRGYGWRSDEWSEQRDPTKEDLDAITGDTPAAFIAKDYHSLWLNSAALAQAGGDLDVAGGVVERDANGEPTGVLREEACWQFKERYILVADEEYLEAMRIGVRLANSRGVTAVHDKDGWLGAVGLWQQLDERGQLSLRVWQSIPADQVDAAAALGLHSGLGSPLLRVGYLKTFMDGTLGSQTAWMLDDSGVRITSGEELAEIIRRGAAAGWPVAVHAIGDKANREALNAFEETRELWEPLGLRHRIEHAQLLHPDDVARFASIGVVASVQFAHAPSDRDLADKYWAGKTDGAYAWRSLLDAGTMLINGSDAPVEELDPLAGVRAGVRRSIDGRPAWHGEQCVTVDEAFHATCVTPAWMARDERRRGTLTPGKLADLVVLDRDPWDDLDSQVVATMVGGRWVHNPPPWD